MYESKFNLLFSAAESYHLLVTESGVNHTHCDTAKKVEHFMLKFGALGLK